MQTFYFILKSQSNQYLKITAETEQVAIDVFMFLHPTGYREIKTVEPVKETLFSEIKQRIN